jgi:zinc D-Ala-D-Ala dipeptidase
MIPARRVPLALSIAGIALASAALWFAQAPAPEPQRAEDLVEIARLDPTVALDIRYATANNFTGRVIYKQARAFLERPAAEALVRAHRALQKDGYGIVIWDAYRPWRVTKLLWDLTPVEKRDFVANPKEGSRHNRGCAVDVTLRDLKTGRELEMPSAFDEMSEAASPDYAGGTPEARANRDRLKAAMEREGFKVRFNEWWHYDYKGWEEYPVLDVDFSEIGHLTNSKGG